MRLPSAAIPAKVAGIKGRKPSDFVDVDDTEITLGTRISDL